MLMDSHVHRLTRLRTYYLAHCSDTHIHAEARSRLQVHGLTRSLSHTPTFTHLQVHAFTRSRINTRSRSNTRLRTQTFTHSHIHPLNHPRTYTFPHSQIQALTHSATHKFKHSYVHQVARSASHTFTHSCATHTNVHTFRVLHSQLRAEQKV